MQYNSMYKKFNSYTNKRRSRSGRRGNQRYMSKKKKAIKINRIRQRIHNRIWREIKKNKNIAKNTVIFRDKAVISQIVGNHIEIEPAQRRRKRKMTKRQRIEAALNRKANEMNAIETNNNNNNNNNTSTTSTTIDDNNNNNNNNNLNNNNNNNSNNNNNGDNNNNNNNLNNANNANDTSQMNSLMFDNTEETPLTFIGTDPSIFDLLKKEEEIQQERKLNRLRELLQKKPIGDTQDQMIEQEIQELMTEINNYDNNMNSNSNNNNNNNNNDNDDNNLNNDIINNNTTIISNSNSNNQDKMEDEYDEEDNDGGNGYDDDDYDDDDDDNENNDNTNNNNNNVINRSNFKSYLNQQIGYSKGSVNSVVKVLKNTKISNRNKKKSTSARIESIKEMYKIKNYMYDNFSYVQSMNMLVIPGQSIPFLSQTNIEQISPNTQIIKRNIKTMELNFLIRVNNNNNNNNNLNNNNLNNNNNNGNNNMVKINSNAYYLIILRQTLEKDNCTKKINLKTIEDMNDHENKILYKDIICIDSTNGAYLKNSQGNITFKILLTLGNRLKWTSRIFPEILLLPIDEQDTIFMQLLGDIKYAITNTILL